MSFGVDHHRLEKGGEGVNSSVKARFALLVRPRMSSQEIDLKLREKAQADSPGASLNNLIKDMVQEVAYRKARLSLTEFIQRFRKNGLADLIAARFANSLFKIDSEAQIGQMVSDQQEEYQAVLDDQEPIQVDHEAEEKRKGAKEYVRESVSTFLEENKLTSTETLFAFLEQMKLDFPNVNISNLFLEEHEAIDKNGKQYKTTLREQVAREINDSLSSIAAAAYKEIFEADKQGFVMGFMMGRVLKYDTLSKQMQFDRKEFSNLIAFLDSPGVAALTQVEGRVLYDWLSYDSREMAKYVQEQKVNAMRFGVRQGIVQAGVMANEGVEEVGVSEKPFFEDDFNVKAFHDRYVKPALIKYHSKKLAKLNRVREVDLVHRLHDTVNLGVGNYTVQMRKYVKALLELSERRPRQYMSQLRELFGLHKSPLLPKMTKKQIDRHFTYFFEKVEEKYHRVRTEALFFRMDNDVWAACSYPEEILQCRDLSQLMRWFVSPADFKKKFPHHQNMSDDQIGYICAMWLKDFMGTMQRMSDKNFIEAEKRRDLLERDMADVLQIKVLKNVEVTFRVLEELDSKGESYAPPVYKVAIDPKDMRSFLNGEDKGLNDRVLATPNMALIKWEGKNYRIFAEEKKKFKKVSMNIPVMRLSKRTGKFICTSHVKTQALIYSGDDHFIHVKEELTRVISQDRGKEVTDENRWMLAFADEVGQEAFKSFLYSRNPQGLIKLEDDKEGRNISNKSKKKPKVASTATFKKGQDFVHTVVMPYAELIPPTKKRPKRKRGEKAKTRPVFQLEKAMLETQCQKLKQLLITNLSEYTISSHDAYRSGRAWPLLFNYYFPPEFFGDQYRAFQVEGFRKEA